MDHNDLNVANSLGRIEGKLDTALTRLDDQEARIRKLEAKAAWSAGAAAVLGAVGGFLFNLLKEKA